MIIIPMLGKRSRFFNAGYVKPTLPLGGLRCGLPSDYEKLNNVLRT